MPRFEDEAETEAIELAKQNGTVGLSGFNKNRTLDLIEIAGQVLRIDMARVENVALGITSDVDEGVSEDGKTVTRSLGVITTVTFIGRVHSDGLEWVEA